MARSKRAGREPAHAVDCPSFLFSPLACAVAGGNESRCAAAALTLLSCPLALSLSRSFVRSVYVCARVCMG